MMRRASIAGVVLVACALSCSGATGDADPILISSVTPSTILPGTDLVISGRGFRDSDVFRVRFSGAAAKGEVEVELAAVFDREDRLRARVTEALVGGAGEGWFDGRIELSRVRGGGSSTVSMPAQLVVARHLTPTLVRLTPGDAYLGDELRLDGDGLLLGGHDEVPEGGDEGDLEVIASGEFHGDRSGVRTLAEVPLPVTARTRTEAVHLLMPD